MKICFVHFARSVAGLERTLCFFVNIAVKRCKNLVRIPKNVSAKKSENKEKSYLCS